MSAGARQAFTSLPHNEARTLLFRNYESRSTLVNRPEARSSAMKMFYCSISVTCRVEIAPSAKVGLRLHTITQRNDCRRNVTTADVMTADDSRYQTTQYGLIAVSADS